MVSLTVKMFVFYASFYYTDKKLNPVHNVNFTSLVCTDLSWKFAKWLGGSRLRPVDCRPARRRLLPSRKAFSGFHPCLMLCLMWIACGQYFKRHMSSMLCWQNKRHCSIFEKGPRFCRISATGQKNCYPMKCSDAKRNCRPHCWQGNLSLGCFWNVLCYLLTRF